MRNIIIYISLLGVIACGGFYMLPVHAAQFNATGILGKYNFNDTPDYTDIARPSTAQGFGGPNGASCIISSSHYLFVVDEGGRVLVYPLDAGDNPATTTALFILGNGGSGASNFSVPYAVACDSVNNRLFLSDQLHNRVLVFNVATSSLVNGESAFYVFGQTNFTSSTAATTQNGLSDPQGIAYDASSSRLFVADYNNSRVLVFPAPPATLTANGNGENASNVLGEAGFMTNSGGTDAATMQNPSGVAYDASSSRLFVADQGNNRVMVYINMASGTIQNDASSSFILGQTNSTNSGTGITASKMNTPFDVAYDASNTRLFVSDQENNRITVFNVASGTLVTNESAIYFLGQSTSTAKVKATSQTGLSGPQASFYDPTTNDLFVSDTGNSRVIVFNVATSTITNGESASYVYGHVDMNGNLKYSAGDADNSPNSWTTYNPHAAVLDAQNHRLFVTDYTEDNPGSRILVYSLDANNHVATSTASYVLGWVDPFTNTLAATASTTFSQEIRGAALDVANQRLFVADSNANRVLVFNVATSTITNGETASLVFGQSSLTSTTAATTQSGMRNPSGIAWDASSSRLFVADSGNNRILVFNVPANATSGIDGEGASLVLGQSFFTSSSSATTAAGLNDSSIAITKAFGFDQNMDYDAANQRLFVPDPGNNRVLVFSVPANATSGIDGENASYVFGQSSFTINASATTQSQMSAPYSVTYDPVWDRLFIADQNNERVLVFDATPATLTAKGNGENAENVIGQLTFTASTTDNFAQNGNGNSQTGAYDPTTNTYFDTQWAPDRVMQFQMIHITTTSLASGTVNSAYSQSITTTSTQGTSQSFSIYSGSLPAGLSLSTTTGVISGTPTVATTSNLILEADDNFNTGSFFDRASLILQTQDVTLTGITPTSTPAGTVGTVYAQTLTAQGGSVPYTWSLVSGVLPAGLALNASSTNSTTSISGTPTALGTSTFTIELQSSGGATTTQAYTMNVAATAPAAPTGPAAAAGNGQVSISFTTGSNGGSPILYYTATASPGGAYATSTGSPIVVGGLANDTAYTFTVTATNAAGTSVASSPSSPTTPTGGSVSVGAGQETIIPVTPLSLPSSTSMISAPSQPATATALQNSLAALESNLALLESEASSSGSIPSPVIRYRFTRNLGLGSMGSDILALQQFLIAQAIGPAALKLKAHGTTKAFASLTHAALIEFQKNEGITPAIGYFGPITRTVVNGMD